MASPQPVGGHALYNVTIITDEKRFETLKDAMEAIGITGHDHYPRPGIRHRKGTD